jgi:hypothetical protein
VGAIEAELADTENLVSIGRPLKSLSLPSWRTGELGGTQVLLTPSWLVCLWGEEGSRLSVQKMDDLVAVYRRDGARVEDFGRVRSFSRAVFLDRHNVKTEVAGTVEGVSRLLAGVVTRVPWALTQFDSVTQRKWDENREQIIAEVDHRRICR